MKKETQKTATPSIEEIAKLYYLHASKSTAEKKDAETYKDDLIAYAKANPALFSGKELKFDCGVRIERREGVKSEYNNDVSLNWLSRAIDAGLGDAINVTIDFKKLPETLDKTQKKSLKEIDFKLTETETFAVCIK